MNTTPIEVDWFLKSLNHHNLSDDDICYYFMEYTSHGGYGASDANQLILNFKKDLSNKGKGGWGYKEQAVQKIAGIYSKELVKIIDFKTSTLIPIPPSKCKANPLHDDRMMTLLKKVSENNGADVREILYLQKDMIASHTGGSRNVCEIMEYISIDEGQCNDVKENIILFDDLLVTGAHFAACKNIILTQFPEKRVFGVFIARVIQ